MTKLLAAGALLLSQLLCRVLASVECGGEPPSGYVKYPADNLAYKHHTEQVTWQEARTRCIAEGADLAVVTTPQQIQRVQSRNGWYTWIGIQRGTGDGGNWIRADSGQSVTSSLPWDSKNEPEVPSCAATYWYDVAQITRLACDQTRPFTCEISLTEDCPGPVGPQGSQEPKGETEKPGERCYDGRPGEKGSKGDPGPSGRDGLAGRTGQAGERGPVGPNGTRGEKGEPGVAGVRGRPGEDGLEGLPGPVGPSGSRGLPGLVGKPGINGEPGPPGPAGQRGEPGPRGIDGVQGPPGPGYNATWFALLAACQEQGEVGGLIDGKSPTDLRNHNLVKQECEEFIAKAYEQMWIAFQNPIEPEVEKESTPKTCRDLFNAHPDTPSGEYWIDPNEDDASDKILVHCDAEKRSTCITPATNQSKVITYYGEEQEVWLSGMEDGMQITYTAGSSQISALQSLSNHAEQKVTYHCMKSVGYFDAQGQTYERGLKLSAWTEVELTPRGRQRLRYDVVSDECQNPTDDWQETVVAYRTDKPVLLPVVDVALGDLGTPEKRAIVEIGEVCFR